MGSKTFKKWMLFLVGSIGVAFSLIVMLVPASNPLPAPLRNVVLSEKNPVRLSIPAIKVDAAVEIAGLTPDGAMAVPRGPSDVAWYEFGPRPGETGSAVISGHFGWKDNIPAVFDDLDSLHRGDKVIVWDKQGTATTFVVRELRSYGENDNALSIFSSSDGKAHLNLITCEGVWNKDAKSYSKRLVVFTDKE